MSDKSIILCNTCTHTFVKTVVRKKIYITEKSNKAIAMSEVRIHKVFKNALQSRVQ